MGILNNLIRVTEQQAEVAGKVLARAFYNYPTFDLLFHDEDEKMRAQSELYEYLVRYGIMFGEVYATSPNFEGVAVWLPFWEANWDEEKTSKCRHPLFMDTDEWNKVYEPIGKWEESCHKKYANFFHWYLYPIGVDPVYQGKGYASILLRAKFTEFDKKNEPCYLETEIERNIPIYQHFGFEIVEGGIIPGTILPYWAMLRKKKL